MDKNRRQFLKIILIGSGVLLAEKIFDPLFSKFFGSSLAKNNSSGKNNFRDFRVVEDKKSLSVYDSSGEEILQIDKGV